MKHTRVFAAALVVLTVAGTSALHAQSSRARRSDQQDSRRYDQQQQDHHDYDQQLQRERQEQSKKERERQLQLEHQQERQIQLNEQRERQLRLEQQQYRQLQIEREYRYNIGGRYRQTNQYGADQLRQAVSYGYQQGVRAGQNDRRNSWRFNYERSPEYRDASPGYSSGYVDQSDYNYYFREGFQRGYEDGYYNSSRYGNTLNGSGSILSSILSAILGF
jgi:hypothetical protein